VNPREARELLERHGAILSGHFELSSGRHSDTYVQKSRLFERPGPTLDVGREIASWYPAIDVVVSPAVGAIVLGFAVAVAAGARSIFAEREGAPLRLRRGFNVDRGERTLVVEDVVTTGRSAAEVHDLVGGLGAERLGVAALVDRSTVPVAFPLRSVVRMEADTWEPGECPLCRRRVPFDSPGSSRLRARSG
jgi:orotate phosphoribosyltransferase